MKYIVTFILWILFNLILYPIIFILKFLWSFKIYKWSNYNKLFNNLDFKIKF